MGPNSLGGVCRQAHWSEATENIQTGPRGWLHAEGRTRDLYARLMPLFHPLFHETAMIVTSNTYFLLNCLILYTYSAKLKVGSYWVPKILFEMLQTCEIP